MKITPKIPEPTTRKSRRVRKQKDKPLVLSPNQKRAIALATRGNNIFITGGAGTGKSFVLGLIIKELKDRYGMRGLGVGIAASTGVAALNIKGGTIHSLLGTKIRGNILEANAYLEELERSEKTPWGSAARDGLPMLRKKFSNLGAIVVDEVSMLTGDYIDMMDWWLREVTGKDEPFGGKQVIFCGDFLQLPPVVRRGSGVVVHFGFQSGAWASAGLQVVALQKVHRQSDRHFVEHLKRLRYGEVPEDTAEYFAECVGREFDIEPTRLFSTNAQVDRFNRKMLDTLPGPEKQYRADIKAPTPNLRKRLLRDAYVNEIIDLRKGADVLLAKNKYDEITGEHIYVNGDRGVVTGMYEKSVEVDVLRTGDTEQIDREEWSLEKVESDGKRKKIASMTQLPLKLAWAVSIHKSQGQSLDPVEVDLDRCFERGQAYVALSRATEYDGLRLVGALKEKHVMVHKACADFHREVEG